MKTLSWQFATFRLSILIFCGILSLGFSANAQVGGVEPNLSTISDHSLNHKPDLTNLETTCQVYKGKPEYKKFVDHIMVGKPGMTEALTDHYPSAFLEAKFVFYHKLVGERNRSHEVELLYGKSSIVLCAELKTDFSNDPIFNFKTGTVQYDSLTYPISAKGENVFTGKTRDVNAVDRFVTVTFTKCGEHGSPPCRESKMD